MTALHVFSPDQEPPMVSQAWLELRGLEYLDSRKNELSRRTVEEHWVTIRKWRRFWAHRSHTPMRVGSFSAVLMEFFEAVFAASVEQKNKNPGRVANKCREHVRAWLNRAQETEALEVMPRFPRRKEEREAARLVAFTRQEVDRLYWSASAIADPRGWTGKYRHADYWRAAIVFFWCYGVDTQTVFRRDTDACPVTWADVLTARAKPDGSGLESEHGWIWYRRKKTGVAYLRPMTRELRAHLAAITPAVPEPDGPIFRSTREPGDVFRGIVKSAGLEGRLDVQTRTVTPWTLKHFRKTAADFYEDHLPGSGSAVLGHASDDRVSRVTTKHYSSRERLAHRAILSLDPPDSFRSLNDREPAAGGLFGSFWRTA